MHYAYEKLTWDISGEFIPGNGQVCEDENIWWKWMVPSKYAWVFWNSLNNVDVGLELCSRPEYVGEDGVLQVHIPQAINN